ncbi:MAG TPA: zinc ribbon domain-containing protein [Terriglobales bacterium]|nr:zinc ribbon domain-containing protein [Terriglobales bacterium]
MFCNHCGSVLPAGAAFCPSCQAQAALIPERKPKVQSHLTLLTALWFAMGAIRLIAALAVFGVASFLLPAISQQQREPIPFFVPTLLTCVGALVALIALLSLAVGWGLHQRAPWARMLALVMAFFSLLSVPLGTALGIYTLVVLLPAESEKEWTEIAGA